MINFGDNEYLTRGEAADLLKRDMKTLDRYANVGILEKYYHGNGLFYKREQVLRLKRELEKVRPERLNLKKLKVIMDSPEEK